MGDVNIFERLEEGFPCPVQTHENEDSVFTTDDEPETNGTSNEELLEKIANLENMLLAMKEKENGNTVQGNADL